VRQPENKMNRMKNKYLHIVLLLVCALPACVSLRTRQETERSYAERYMGEHVYLIVARAADTADEAAAQDYFYRRAQELLKKKRYLKYEVIEMGSDRRYTVSVREYIDTKIKTIPRPYIYSRIKFYRR
jgi:hypothetical protein